MIAIVDYGVGNLFSLRSSFQKIGAEAIVASDKRTIENAEKIILPGVGAFEDAAKKLRATGLDEVVKAEVEKGKYRADSETEQKAIDKWNRRVDNEV